MELAKKEIYTGTYKGVEDYCPAYVSRENWLKLQERGFVKSAQCNRIYLFSGLIKCPGCNRNMSARYSIQKLKDGTEKEYYSYRCPDKSLNLCSNKHSVFQLKMETWLLEHLKELALIEIDKVEIAKKQPRPKSKTNIKALKESLRRLNVSYMAGNIDDEEYLDMQKEIKAAIKKAESQDPENIADKDTSILNYIVETDFKAHYETLDDEDKRAFWRYVIKEIHVEGNEIVSVDFNS